MAASRLIEWGCYMRRLLVVALFGLFSSGLAAQSFDDAMKMYRRGDHAAALEIWKPLASNGNVDAQYNLGVMYAAGIGTDENDTRAVEWFRQAAMQGHPIAQRNLGIMYANGEGTASNFKRSYVWLQLAANRGDVHAREALDMLREIMDSSELGEVEARLAGAQ